MGMESHESCVPTVAHDLTTDLCGFAGSVLSGAGTVFLPLSSVATWQDQCVADPFCVRTASSVARSLMRELGKWIANFMGKITITAGGAIWKKG